MSFRTFDINWVGSQDKYDMEYGKVVTGTTGGTLAATGIGLGYAWVVALSFLVVGIAILGIRLYFRRGV
jgi:hypothetical protein